ncbi:uncharacterized protein LOC116416855 [Nasonia vitripennis]|uniref:Uncharacterized protein n=1 Tax=Nasonia vitripennis TaxID=7425 RepID=A0A7M7Q706_NASVI|nr:uncharacterized protein LOC116416855 [Nasonia vitripennis]
MRYVELYPWYYMPPSIHTILIHGHLIVQAVVLLIGMFSEEAQECKNKDIKRYRENHSRKTSRTETNMDTFKRLLLSSDPLISLSRKLPKKNHQKLSAEVKSLLVYDSEDEESENESC